MDHENQVNVLLSFGNHGRKSGGGTHGETGAILVVLNRGHRDPAKAARLFQVVGAVCGAILAHFMFELPLIQESAKLRTGMAQWGSEFVATFGLLATIFGTLRWQAKAVPMMVGLYITAAYWFTASTSFANPAVTFARSFTNTFSGIFPEHALGFIVAQLAAAVIGAYALRWLFSPTRKRVFHFVLFTGAFPCPKKILPTMMCSLSDQRSDCQSHC